MRNFPLRVMVSLTLSRSWEKLTLKKARPRMRTKGSRLCSPWADSDVGVPISRLSPRAAAIQMRATLAMSACSSGLSGLFEDFPGR